MAKILVVDDEVQIGLIFTTFLTKLGFDVVRASGGAEAIGLLTAGLDADLMIIDMKMPEVSGLDVLKAKRNLNNNKPVIIVTGSMGQDRIYKELEAFAFDKEDILYKPVDLFVLRDLVKKKLGGI